MEQQPKINLQFVRHGDPDRSDPSAHPDTYPLTETSKEGLRTLRDQLDINPDTTIGFHGDNLRSKQTIEALVRPDSAEEQEFEKLNYKARLDDDLLYKINGNFTAFKEYLGVQPSNKILFRLIKDKSDDFKNESGLDFTAYQDMVDIVCDYILKYTHVLSSWKKVSDKYSTAQLSRLFCANEYFYPSFRTAITHAKLGAEAAEAYVVWFEKNIERNEDRKHDECSVIIREDESGAVVLTIHDTYGDLECTPDDILTIRS